MTVYIFRKFDDTKGAIRIPKSMTKWQKKNPKNNAQQKNLHRQYILLKTILNSGVPGGKIASSSCSTNKNQWKVIFSYWWWSKYGLWLQHTEHGHLWHRHSIFNHDGDCKSLDVMTSNLPLGTPGFCCSLVISYRLPSKCR